MSFVAVGYTVMEDAGSVVLEVKRVGNIPVTVNVTTTDETALGEIYTYTIMPAGISEVKPSKINLHQQSSIYVPY